MNADLYLYDERALISMVRENTLSFESFERELRRRDIVRVAADPDYAGALLAGAISWKGVKQNGR